ncbi:peptidase [Rhodobacterales bacterium 52_120_T64]|nr:peptidase [Rhodobacterales bacterium 52_120_T64]
MRNDVVAVARRWIGTPYQHQASCEGAGTDCLGLVRGIWREVYGEEPASVPAYTPDWSEAAKDERLLVAMGTYFRPVSDEVQTGDVLVFRLRSVAKHLAVVSAQGKIIHAYSGRGVVETPLSPAWERRIAGVFRFPDRSN